MSTMKRTAPNSFAERAGRTLGRMWRGFLRRERSACEWLTAQGLPPGIARALLLIVRLAVLGVALYVAFWVVLLWVFAIVAARMARNTDWEMPELSPKWKEPEWREGLEGYGLYTYDEFRIDPYFYEDD
jgi:hypothetical protein